MLLALRNEFEKRHVLGLTQNFVNLFTDENGFTNVLSAVISKTAVFSGITGNFVMPLTISTDA